MQCANVKLEKMEGAPKMIEKVAEQKPTKLYFPLVSRESLATLQDGEKLNDDIIDTWLYNLVIVYQQSNLLPITCHWKQLLSEWNSPQALRLFGLKNI